VPGWAGDYGAGRVAIWAGHEGFFGGGADGRFDNDVFRGNLITWLLQDGRRLGLTSGHSEWLTLAGFSPALTTALSQRGVVVGDAAGSLTPDTLADYDALVVGNPWGELSTAEIAALEQWVRGGGGLLVLGLGWSWYANHPDPTGADYAVNRLGTVFGWQVEDGQIEDPDAPNSDSAQPAFRSAPLADYTPARVVVLRAAEADIDSVKQLAVEQPGDIYIIEGQYTGLQLPTAKWAGLNSPSQALAILDRAYTTHLALIGGANRPYGGAVIWYESAADPQGEYWMHSGNPIIYKQEAADEIITSLNAGWPGWGMLHELGHDFVISACGDMFVHSGTDEPWCNVFTVWSIEHNGWPQRENTFDAGHAYAAQAQPDFAQLTSDPWPLLGCLELIWSRYGWEGMQRLLTRAATDCAAGVTPEDDAWRTDYLAEQLSQGYGVDLAPVLEHWGFTVSPAACQQTAGLPPAQL
jgi:hypothetical protein